MEDIEKGVDTTELWVERLRIAAVEHYSRHQVPQDILIQKKTAEYVKQTMGSSTTGHINGTGNTNNNNNGSTHSSSNGLDNEIRIPKIVDPVVKIHAEEMSESETAFMLEQGRIGINKTGHQLGLLAGWLKDTIDQEYGPDWQVIVGKQGSFGSCLSPMAGHYINFSIDAITFLIFRAN